MLETNEQKITDFALQIINELRDDVLKIMIIKDEQFMTFVLEHKLLNEYHDYIKRITEKHDA